MGPVQKAVIDGLIEDSDYFLHPAVTNVLIDIVTADTDSGLIIPLGVEICQREIIVDYTDFLEEVENLTDVITEIVSSFRPAPWKIHSEFDDDWVTVEIDLPSPLMTSAVMN